MEMDYDKSHWEASCPQVKCKNKPCCCGLEFVSIPTSLAEEMTPQNGAFANAIVRYENNGEIWIYDRNGVPVKIKEGA